MPAVLKVLADGLQRPLKQVYDDVVSEEQLALTLPTGKLTYVRSRVGWAKTYLVKAGLIHQPKRGICEITNRGREALATGQLINNDSLTPLMTLKVSTTNN